MVLFLHATTKSPSEKIPLTKYTKREKELNFSKYLMVSNDSALGLAVEGAREKGITTVPTT